MKKSVPQTDFRVGQREAFLTVHQLYMAEDVARAGIDRDGRLRVGNSQVLQGDVRGGGVGVDEQGGVGVITRQSVRRGDGFADRCVIAGGHYYWPIVTALPGYWRIDCQGNAIGAFQNTTAFK